MAHCVCRSFWVIRRATVHDHCSAPPIHTRARMAIIVSKSGKNAQRLERTVIQQEDYLQQYIYDNPESLPLHELKEDLRLLIVAREFPTASGPIDALGVDADGEIYVIETKLYKNPDKRLVVAQMLDYGASLWSTYSDTGRFIAALEERAAAGFGIGLAAKLSGFYGIEGEALSGYYEALRRNVSDGRFRFVVLMDRLHDRLKDLISFVNANSRFVVLGVELEFYQHQDFEIIIPNLYGAEGRSGVMGPAAGGARRKWDKPLFFADVEAKLDGLSAEPVRSLYEWSVHHADTVTWGSGMQLGSFNAKFTHVNSASVFTVFTNGTLSLNFVSLREPEHSADYARRLAEGLRQLGGFTIPPDFMQRQIHVPYGQWAPHVGALFATLQTVLVPSQ
jgi:hypothetical protein